MQRSPYTFISINWTSDDIAALVDEHNDAHPDQPLDLAVAEARAAAWARHIEETASTICGEQLASVIACNVP